MGRNENQGGAIEPAYLGPQFDPGKHQIYVDQLKEALRDPRYKNIALTGAYGTGKSSALRGLADSLKDEPNLKPVFVNLAPLTLSAGTSVDTEFLQKEILKLLIFREDPAKMTRSTFRGIIILPWWRKLLSYFALATFALLFILALNSAVLADFVVGGATVLGNGAGAVLRLVALFLLFVLVIGLMDFAILEKPRLKALSVGVGRLELRDEETSYFDKYLAEIIYYFRVSRTNVVIFEDLDRFDEPGIFESLRGLNEQVNAALENANSGRCSNARRNLKPVRFIYATRDSIFVPVPSQGKGISGDNEGIENLTHEERHGVKPEESFLRSAENRTKFFDLIIPMAPFSTYRNAYEFLRRQLETSHPKLAENRKLLALIGESISDHRTLLNISYEFQLFDHIAMSGLRRDKLLALVAYKNLHLEDFEALSRGQSTLDYLSRDYSDFVTVVQEEIAKHLKALSGSLERSEMSEGLLSKLDASLVLWLDRIIGEEEKVEMGSLTMLIDNKSFDMAEESDRRDFWQTLAGMDLRQATPNIRFQTQQMSGSERLESNVFDYMLYSRVPDGEYRAMKSQEVTRKIDALNRFSSESRRGSIHGFLESANQSAERIVNEAGERLAGKIDEIIPTNLGRNLIKHGYIDMDFYLYASTFEEEALSTPEAQLFLVNQVERIAPNPYLELSDETCRAVADSLKESQKASLAGAANGDLLLWLGTPEGTRQAPDLLVAILDDFIADFERSVKLAQLVNAIALRPNSVASDRDKRHACETVIHELAARAPGLLSKELFELLDENALRMVVNTTLAASDKPLQIDRCFRDFIAENYRELPVFTNEGSVGKATLEQAAQGLRGLAVEVELSGLSKSAIVAFALYGYVAVSVENYRKLKEELQIEVTLVGLWNNPGLLFESATAHIQQYLATIAEMGEFSVAKDETAVFFPEVFGKIYDKLSDLDRVQDWESIDHDEFDEQVSVELLGILSRVEEGVVAPDITGIDYDTYRPLVQSQVMLPTLSNINAYIKSNGNTLDSELAMLLNAKGIAPGNDEPEDVSSRNIRKSVIRAVIDFEQWPGGEAKRRDVLKQISHEGIRFAWGDFADLTPDKASQLLELDLVEKSAEDILVLQKQDGQGLVHAFLRGSGLPAESFEPRVLVQLNDYSSVLCDGGISEDIRLRVIDVIAEFVEPERLDADDAFAVLRCAYDFETQLGAAFLLEIAGVLSPAYSEKEKCELLIAHVLKLPPEELDEAFLGELFRFMGTDFEDLLTIGGGPRTFDAIDGLEKLMDIAQAKINAISRVIPDGAGKTLKVTKRRKK